MSKYGRLWCVHQDRHSDRFACFRRSFFFWKATSRFPLEVVLCETRGQRSASVRHHDDLRRGCGRSGHREVLAKPSHWMIRHGLSDPFEGGCSTKPTF
jgi:hypothetical protein